MAASDDRERRWLNMKRWVASDRVSGTGDEPHSRLMGLGVQARQPSAAPSCMRAFRIRQSWIRARSLVQGEARPMGLPGAPTAAAATTAAAASEAPAASRAR